jgi:hypothetical protein
MTRLALHLDLGEPVQALGPWTGMGPPNNITRGKNGSFSISEQEGDGNRAYVCVRDGQGNVLARMERAISTASTSTRRHLRRRDPGPQRRQVRAAKLSGRLSCVAARM